MVISVVGFPKSMDISKQIDKRGATSISWFGEYLKNILKERNMTQSDLAKYFPSKTGGLTGCVHNWIEGKNMPTIEQFNKICEILNLPFDKLKEAEREIIGKGKAAFKTASEAFGGKGWGTLCNDYDITVPATDLAKQWQGWRNATQTIL